MREEIAAYLRSVGALYPGGIPRALIGARPAVPPMAPAAAQEFKITFLWLDSDFSGSRDPLADEAGQLLKAAIEKGLKLSERQVRIVRAGESTALAAAFAAPLAPIVVLLGDTAASAVGEEDREPGVCGPGASDTHVMRTLNLSSVLSDQGSKKIFWSHLQGILKQL